MACMCAQIRPRSIKSHPKVLGNRVRTHVNFSGKSPLQEAERRVEPATLHHVGQIGRQTGKHSRYHIWSEAWPGRGAPKLEEFSEHGQARASQHRSPEGKRSGERKRPTFQAPRSGTISVQPGKYWHCLEGNLGETGEKRDGARMSLSEHYDAILS